MKKTPSLLLLAIIFLFISSCKNSGVNGLAIPKDASMVVHFNGASLTSKLSWDEIKQADWFKENINEEKDEYKKKLLNDPEASGVNIKSDFVYFQNKAGNGEYGAFLGNIKDAAAFEKLVTSIHKDVKVEKSGDLNTIIMGGSNIVTWNKSKFIVLTNEHSPLDESNEFKRVQMDDDTPPLYNPPTPLSADTLVTIGKELMNLSNSKSLNDDKRYTSLLKENGDIHIWMNTEKLYAAQGAPMLSLMKFGDMLKGNISATTVNFDNGKINFFSKQYMSKDLAQIFEDHKPQPVSAEVINKIPGENIIAAFAANMPTEGLKAFLKLSGMDGFANMFLSKYKVTVDELINAYKGEMVVALSQNSQSGLMDSADMEHLRFSSGPDFMFGMAINDKPSFDKLLGLIKSELFSDEDSAKFKFQTNDQWFALGSNPTTLQSFIAGGNNNHAFTNLISGHPVGGFIDIQKILSSGKFFPMSSSAADSTFQNIIFTGGEYADGALTLKTEINFVNKSTNSLKQVYQLGTKFFMHQRSEMQKHFKNDQVTIPGQMDSTTIQPQ